MHRVPPTSLVVGEHQKGFLQLGAREDREVYTTLEMLVVASVGARQRS